jgi:hypothetical protein
MFDSGGSKAKTGYKVVSASVNDSMPSSIGRFTVCRSDWLFSAPAEVESPNEFPGAHAYWTRLNALGHNPNCLSRAKKRYSLGSRLTELFGAISIPLPDSCNWNMNDVHCQVWGVGSFPPYHFA